MCAEWFSRRARKEAYLEYLDELVKRADKRNKARAAGIPADAPRDPETAPPAVPARLGLPVSGNAPGSSPSGKPASVTPAAGTTLPATPCPEMMQMLNEHRRMLEGVVRRAAEVEQGQAAAASAAEQAAGTAHHARFE